MFKLRATFPVVAIVALACLTSCKEEDTRLFDESGVWSLERYSLDGTPYQEINQGRKNRFLLRFKPEDGVVATAACAEEGFDPDVNSSTCTNAALSMWECRCFAYTYDVDTMVWQEFVPGDTPPPVDAPGDESPSHELMVSPFGEVAGAFEWDSLPAGLFNSDGDISKHAFGQKAPGVWTDVDLNMDGTPDLEYCSQQCFPSEKI